MLALALALSACSVGDGKLMNLKQDGAGPDEFGIVPTKSLETPEDLAFLPEPTLGGSNRVDQTPRRDAVAALGGRTSLMDSDRIQSGEQALISAAGRFGVNPDIRAITTAEDEAFRGDALVLPLERLFKVNVYLQTYEPLSLDAQRELLRLRQLGIRTPTSPPPPQN
jgi:hypothetical protein